MIIFKKCLNLLSITSRFIQKKANEKFHGEMRSGYLQKGFPLKDGPFSNSLMLLSSPFMLKGKVILEVPSLAIMCTRHCRYLSIHKCQGSYSVSLC